MPSTASPTNLLTLSWRSEVLAKRCLDQVPVSAACATVALGLTSHVSQRRMVDRHHDNDAELLPPPRAPLVVLDEWPTACRSERDCEVSGTVYPAPDSLGRAEIFWWLDNTELRVNASRNLLNNSVAAVLAALLAAGATSITAVASNSPWATALAAAISVLAVVLAGRVLLKDSDHAPLEQRLLLYRQRARDLETLEADRATDSDPSVAPGRPSEGP